MEKFKKLSRNEMKKIGGGSGCSCGVVGCWVETVDGPVEYEYAIPGYDCGYPQNDQAVCDGVGGTSNGCACVPSACY